MTTEVSTTTLNGTAGSSTAAPINEDNNSSNSHHSYSNPRKSFKKSFGSVGSKATKVVGTSMGTMGRAGSKVKSSLLQTADHVYNTVEHVYDTAQHAFNSNDHNVNNNNNKKKNQVDVELEAIRLMNDGNDEHEDDEADREDEVQANDDALGELPVPSHVHQRRSSSNSSSINNERRSTAMNKRWSVMAFDEVDVISSDDDDDDDDVKEKDTGGCGGGGCDIGGKPEKRSSMLQISESKSKSADEGSGRASMVGATSTAGKKNKKKKKKSEKSIEDTGTITTTTTISNISSEELTTTPSTKTKKKVSRSELATPNSKSGHSATPKKKKKRNKLSKVKSDDDDDNDNEPATPPLKIPTKKSKTSKVGSKDMEDSLPLEECNELSGTPTTKKHKKTPTKTKRRFSGSSLADKKKSLRNQESNTDDSIRSHDTSLSSRRRRFSGGSLADKKKSLRCQQEFIGDDSIRSMDDDDHDNDDDDGDTTTRRGNKKKVKSSSRALETIMGGKSKQHHGDEEDNIDESWRDDSGHHSEGFLDIKKKTKRSRNTQQQQGRSKPLWSSSASSNSAHARSSAISTMEGNGEKNVEKLSPEKGRFRKMVIKKFWKRNSINKEENDAFAMASDAATSTSAAATARVDVQAADYYEDEEQQRQTEEDEFLSKVVMDEAEREIEDIWGVNTEEENDRSTIVGTTVEDGDNPQVQDSGQDIPDDDGVITTNDNARKLGTKTGSKWGVVKSSAYFLKKGKDSAMFAKLFDGDEDNDDDDIYVEGNDPEGVGNKPPDRPMSAAEYDQRLAGIEELEANMAKEREALQEERQRIAFERESLELQVEDEEQKNDALNQKVHQLELQLEEQEILGENKQTQMELTAEIDALKLQLQAREREEHQRLIEKISEIEKLKDTIGELKNDDQIVDFAVNPHDGKSPQRLQGELLQAISKLSERDDVISQQRTQIEEMTEELLDLKNGSAVDKLKDQLAARNKENHELKDELTKTKAERDLKIKSKDETIAFLIEELGKLKKAQSEAKGNVMGSIGSTTGFISLNDGKKGGGSNGSNLRNNEETDDDSDAERMDSSQHSISTLLGFAGFGRSPRGLRQRIESRKGASMASSSGNASNNTAPPPPDL